MKGDSGAVPAGVAMRCPRCDSANTKFCYYNNYSLSQPRHFCKSCRRYWTRGGALRNVPVGGGCRKSKKLLKPSLSPAHVIAASALFSPPAMDFPPPGSSWLAAPDHLGGAIQQIMNQDLHWKLHEQQRLSLLFSKDHHSVNVPQVVSSFAAPVPHLVQQGDVAAAGWFSGNSYANDDHMAAGAGNIDVGTTWNINNGFQAWTSGNNNHFSTA